MPEASLRVSMAPAMDSACESAQRLLGAGLERTRARRFGEASQQFLAALQIIEGMPDTPERARQLGLAADLCASTGHPDIALMALQGLLESGERSSRPERHCAALLTLANSW